MEMAEAGSIRRALLNILWGQQVAKDTQMMAYVGNLQAAARDGSAVGPAASQEQLDELVETLNQDLKQFGFEIQRGLSETDSAFYYVLCNTRPDEQSRVATSFTPTELQFIKKLVRYSVNEWWWWCF